MRRLSKAVLLLTVIFSVLLSMLVHSAAVPARASGSLGIASSSCSGVTLNASGFQSDGFLSIVIETFDAAGTLKDYVFNDYLTSVTRDNLTVTARWPTKPAGTGFAIYSSTANDLNTPPGQIAFADFFICNVAGPGAPDGSVLGSFAANTQLYSEPNSKAVLSGLTIKPGQTWFIFGISPDKRWYHVYITNGQAAWVRVESARLLGSAPWAAVRASDEDDNGTTDTPVVTLSTGSSTISSASAANLPAFVPRGH